MNNAGLAGVVLAGGRSSRFGSPKALAELGGRRLIDHAVAELTRVASEVLVATNTPKLFSDMHGVKIVCDAVPNLGPLGGIQTAFGKTSCERLLVLGCDTIATSASIDALITARPANAVIALDSSRPQYLCAIYSRALLDRFKLSIDLGRLSLGAALSGIDGVTFVPVPEASIININTVHDLTRAKEMRDAR